VAGWRSEVDEFRRQADKNRLEVARLRQEWDSAHSLLASPAMPPIIEHYTKVSHQQAVELMVGVHRATGGLVGTFTRSNYRIEVAALGMSVLTLGGLWALIAASQPGAAAWVGGIFSTLMALLKGYQLTFGPRNRIKEAYALYQAIGKAIAALRGTGEFNVTRFWDQYKGFEDDLTKLENPAAP
jgi:hypothetical protein